MRVVISVILALAMTLTSASLVLAGDTVKGKASNYAGTAGFIGTPGVALPGPLGGRYTGQIRGYVTVCADRCVKLPTFDYCDCYWNRIGPNGETRRVVDLNFEAWALVSNKSRSAGLIDVTLHFGPDAPQGKGPAHWTPSSDLPDTAMSR
jgi:hypothetical protein